MSDKLRRGASLITLEKAKTRKETLAGREYLVAPAVLLIPGIRNGEMVPGDEICAIPGAWEGIPVTIFHPETGDGRNVPEVMAKAVGNVFNVFCDERQAVRGEVWLDVAKVNELGGNALRAMQLIENGDALPVSTGYFLDLDITTDPPTHRSIRPGHLALLPGGEGACSWEEGCGVRRNERKEKKEEAGTGEPASATNQEGGDMIGRLVEVFTNLFNHLRGREATQEDTPNSGEEESRMELKEVINQVIASDANQFTENDRPFLEGLGENVGKLLAKPAEAKREQAEKEVEGKAPQAAGEGDCGCADQAKLSTGVASESAGDSTAGPQPSPGYSAEQLAKDVGVSDVSELKDVVTAAVAERKARRAALVKAVAEHSDFNEEDLRDRSLDELVKLSRLVGGGRADFTGVPAPGAGVEDRSAPPPPPSYVQAVQNRYKEQRTA